MEQQKKQHRPKGGERETTAPPQKEDWGLPRCFTLLYFSLHSLPFPSLTLRYVTLPYPTFSTLFNLTLINQLRPIMVSFSLFSRIGFGFRHIFPNGNDTTTQRRMKVDEEEEEETAQPQRTEGKAAPQKRKQHPNKEGWEKVNTTQICPPGLQQRTTAQKIQTKNNH